MLEKYGIHFRLMIVTSIVCGAIFSFPLLSSSLWAPNIVFAGQGGGTPPICTDNEPNLACLTGCNFDDGTLSCGSVEPIPNCIVEDSDEDTATITCLVDGSTETFECDSDVLTESGACALVSSTSGVGGSASAEADNTNVFDVRSSSVTNNTNNNNNVINIENNASSSNND